MEIVIGIIVIAVIIFVIGGMDNDRPVSEWSDEKLVRMREKLPFAIIACSNILHTKYRRVQQRIRQ
jgi:hypothetical protein